MDTEIRTSGALMDSVELVPMLAGSEERTSLPARHSAVPVASGVTGHIGLPAGGGDVTLPGEGPPDSPSAGTATHLPAHSRPPGEFYRCETPCLPLPTHGPSMGGGLGSIPALLLEIQVFGRNPMPRKLIFFFFLTLQ